MKLSAATSIVNDKFGIGTVADFKAKDITTMPCISTGNMVIDFITGIGGLPRNRITELHGLESCGKTTAALLAAITCQSLGESVVYEDYENSFDPDYFVGLGGSLDPDLFALLQPRTMEDGFRLSQFYAEKVEKVGMHIYDSVAAMGTAQDIDHEIGETQIGTQAQVMSLSLKQMRNMIGHSNAAWVFINQLREVIDLSWGGQRKAKMVGKTYSTPGGRALKFFADLRLEFMPAGFEKEEVYNQLSKETEKQVIGAKVKVTAVKNKCAAPWRSSLIHLTQDIGIDNAYTLVDLAIKHGILAKTGSHFVLRGELCPSDRLEYTLGSMEQVSEFMRGNKPIELILRNKTWQALTQ